MGGEGRLGQNEDDVRVVTHGSVEIRWSVASRVAEVIYAPGTRLTAPDGDVLVDALTSWIGAGDEPFGVLAHAAGVESTDGPYRARTGDFFRKHCATAFIAMLDMGPVLGVVVDLFRVGTGIELKAFRDEQKARAWLRTKGVRA